MRFVRGLCSLKVKANPLKNQNLLNYCMNFPEIHVTTALYISCHYYDQKQYDFQVTFQINLINK